MVWYLVVPFYFTKWVIWGMVKVGMVKTGDGTRYDRFFGVHSFNYPNYVEFIKDVKNKDNSTYWGLVILPNVIAALILWWILYFLF